MPSGLPVAQSLMADGLSAHGPTAYGPTAHVFPGILTPLAFTTGELLWVFGFSIVCVLIVLSPLIVYVIRRKKP
ncbi:MAG: hypothetical protein V2A71_00790 [Candidatus Eisenbacteria bacterium]